MEPRIQYAKTSDGVSIAYIAEGTGPTLVQTTRMPFSALIELEVHADAKAALEARARLARIVAYDCRGTGLSDRAVTDFSVDALVQDLEAVVSRVADSGPIWLFAGFTLTPVAIAFAARHPETVAKMVLWCGFSSGAEISIGEWDGAIELAQRDWETA